MYILGIDPESRDEIAQFTPGQYGVSGAGEGHIYAQASGAISANSPCVYVAGQASELSTSNDAIGARIGWCNATVFADGEHGWLMVLGEAVAEANGAMVAGLAVTATSEAGNVRTHASSSPYLAGVHVPAGIPNNSTGTVHLSWPAVAAR